MNPSSSVARELDQQFVAWLSLGQLITWGSVFYTFALLMEPVERELGLTRAQSSLAFSMSLLAEGALGYWVGRWIDRGHERVVMTSGSLLVAACLLLHSMVDSAAGFYMVWIGLGVGTAFTSYSPAFAVVTRRFPDHFRRAIITLTFLGGLASTVFIPLSAWLIESLGWRHALWVLAGMHLLICAPLHAVQLRGARVHTGPRPAPSVVSSSATRLMRSPPFLLVGLFVVLMMGVTTALPPHMVSLLRGQGMAESWVIAIPATIGLMQVLGRLVLYFFEHHFDIHLANRIIPMMFPISMVLLLTSANHPWVALIFVLLFGMSNGMVTIVKGTAIAQYVNREHVATLNGALGFPVAVARSLAPLLLGLMWTAQAGYTYGLWLLLGLSLLAVAALMLAQRKALPVG